MQLLLLNLQAHKPALQLLRLPFNAQEILADDYQTREVILAAYRLLKGMAVGFGL